MKKKLIAAVFFIIYCLTVVTLNAQSLGDVDTSGGIDIVDALLIAQYYVGLEALEFHPELADVSGEGSVDIVDALLVAKFYVGLIDEFPASSVTATPTSPTPLVPTPLPGEWEVYGSKTQDDGYWFIYQIQLVNQSGSSQSGDFVFRFFVMPEGEIDIANHYDESSAGYQNPSTGSLKNFFGNHYYYDISMGQRTIAPRQYIGYKGNIKNDDGQINSSNDWSGSQLGRGDLEAITHVVVLKDGVPIAGILPQQKPVADFSYKPRYPDVNEIITLDASLSSDPDSSIASYEWIIDENLKKSGIQIRHSFSSSGKHSVTLRVSDVTGLIDEKHQLVYVTNGPIADFSWEKDSTPGVVNFDASASTDKNNLPLIQYDWDFGDGTSASGQRISHSYSDSNGVYKVVLRAINSAGAAMSVSQEIRFSYFITRKGSKLYEGDVEYRFVSANIPNYFIIEDAAGTLTPRWHRASEFEQRDAARAIKRLGGQMFRTYVFSVDGGRNVEGGLAHIYKDNSTGEIKYNEDLFKDVDMGLAVAKEEGVKVMIPFVDNWAWFGGYAEWASLTGASDFWSDPLCKTAFKNFLSYLLNRTNSITGIKYKDDTTIFAWELGNEIDKSNDTWVSEMAAHIKSIDQNHLLVDGSHKSIPENSYTDPNIDIVTTHYTDSQVTSFARQAAENNKPYIYGEYQPASLPQIQAVVNDVISSGAAGCMIWCLRSRTEYGGFYFHTDFGGTSDALQYPGFSDGQDTTDEREIFNILREGAFRIRAMAEPLEDVPPAPVLLPITSSGEINWQGSAGAYHYIVQRRADNTGVWLSLANNVSDGGGVDYNGNRVADLPLYVDNPGSGSWEYRIIAVNGAGESVPSNVVTLSR